MVVLAVVLAFGGGDQYLGSLLAHPWAADVSVLSALWIESPSYGTIAERRALYRGRRAPRRGRSIRHEAPAQGVVNHAEAARKANSKR